MDFLQYKIFIGNVSITYLHNCSLLFCPRQLGKKLDVALVVSMGSGIFPPEVLGKTDAQEFLYFGKHWLRAAQAIKARAKSLITLLTTAVSVLRQ